MKKNSKRIAGILGPVLMAIPLSEFPLVQPQLYDEQTPPVVYLSGVFFFVGGLLTVRNHNHWTRDWTVLVTMTGWGSILLGLIRMFGAGQYRQRAENTSSITFMLVELFLFGIGLVMTTKAYNLDSRILREGRKTRP
jgi:hypothetical protein